MLSNFKSIAMEIIKDKETEVYNPEEKAGDIERKLNSGEIDLAGAMEALKSEFSYELSSDDYSKIEKEVGYNVK
jgi:hypothetical protein